MERRRYIPPTYGSAVTQVVDRVAAAGKPANSLKRPRTRAEDEQSVTCGKADGAIAGTSNADKVIDRSTEGVAQHAETSPPPPPQSFTLQLTRATGDAAWGFLIYKTSYPIRVGRVDTAILHARRIVANEQEATNVANEVIPLLQKNDIIVRIDDVAPENHDAAMQLFFRPKLTMRILVQRLPQRSASSRSSCISVTHDAQVNEVTLHSDLSIKPTAAQSTHAATVPPPITRGRLGLPAPSPLARAVPVAMSSTATPRQPDTMNCAGKPAAVSPTPFSQQAGSDNLFPWLDENVADRARSEGGVRCEGAAVAVLGSTDTATTVPSAPTLTLTGQLLQHDTRRDAMWRSAELTRDELLHGCSVLLPPPHLPHATPLPYSPNAVHDSLDAREGGTPAWLPPLLSGDGDRASVEAARRHEQAMTAERRRQTDAARSLARDVRATLVSLYDADGAILRAREWQPTETDSISREGLRGLQMALACLPASRRHAVHDRTHCPFGPEEGFSSAFHDGVQAFMTSLALFRTRQSLANSDALAGRADDDMDTCSLDEVGQVHTTGAHEHGMRGGTAVALPWEMGGLDWVSKAQQHLLRLRHSHGRVGGSVSLGLRHDARAHDTKANTPARQTRACTADSNTVVHDDSVGRGERLAAMHGFMNAIMMDNQARRLRAEKEQQARLQVSEAGARRWRETYASLAQLNAQHVQEVRRHRQELLRGLMRTVTTAAATRSPPEVRGDGGKAVMESVAVAEDCMDDDDARQRESVLGNWTECPSQLARRPQRGCHQAPQDVRGDGVLLSNLPLPSGLQNRPSLFPHDTGATHDAEVDKVTGPRSARLGLPSPPPPYVQASLMHAAVFSDHKAA